MIRLLHTFSTASTVKCPLILPLQKQYLEKCALQCKGLLKNSVQVVPEWRNLELAWSVAMASFPAVLQQSKAGLFPRITNNMSRLFQDCQAKGSNFTYLWKVTSNLIINPSQLNGKLDQGLRKIGWNCYFVYYCTVFILWNNTNVFRLYSENIGWTK